MEQPSLENLVDLLRLHLSSVEQVFGDEIKRDLLAIVDVVNTDEEVRLLRERLGLPLSSTPARLFVNPELHANEPTSNDAPDFAQSDGGLAIVREMFMPFARKMRAADRQQMVENLEALADELDEMNAQPDPDPLI